MKFVRIPLFRYGHNDPNANIYDVRTDILGDIGDVIDNKWIVIDSGEKAIRVANLYWIEFLDTTEDLSYLPYLTFHTKFEDCNVQLYRYKVDHHLLSKQKNKKFEKIKEYLEQPEIQNKIVNIIFEELFKNAVYVDDVKLGDKAIYNYLQDFINGRV